MARNPKVNWTPCYNQYTCTIDGTFHRLGKDKIAAGAQFKFLLRQADRGGPADTNATFLEVADAYLDQVELNHSPDRLRNCRQRLQEFKRFLGNDFRVKNLRAKQIDEWLADRKIRPGTERLYKAMILSCLNWAARPLKKKGGELIYENPLRGQVHLPKDHSRGQEAVWKPETLKQVLKVSNPAFADLVRILTWTGARPSTVIRIEARHYNKAQSRWDCEDLNRGGKKWTKYVRLLNDDARQLVERLNKKHPSGPIFRNAYGNPWEPQAPQIYLTNLQNKFKATKKLKWQDGLCVYGLRHTFATNFLQKFPNEIEYLRVLLNHKDYKMILQHYGHLIDQDRAAFKRMEGFNLLASSRKGLGRQRLP